MPGLISRCRATLVVLIVVFLCLSKTAFGAQITVGWDPPADPGVTGYKVYYGIASNTYGTPVDAGNVLVYTLTGLTAGQTYFIAVTSHDALSHESIHSNEVSGVAKVPCTVATSPVGLGITVDGSAYTAPHTFNWVPGTSHTVSVASPQSGVTGVQYVYGSWSDGGGQSHSDHGSVIEHDVYSYVYDSVQFDDVDQALGGGSVSPSGTNWYNSAQVVSVLATPNAGYSFGSWTGDLSGSTNPSNVTMSGPKSVTANFTQNQYTLAVSVSPTGSGSVTKSPNKTTYVYGDVVTLTASANTGYSFASWSGDASGTTNPYALTINGNKSVTANFTQNQYTLSVGVSPTGSGSVAKSPDKASYVYGDVVTLTASANTGYSFASWSGDASGTTNPYALTINGNKSVTANFTQNQYTLSVGVSPTGSGSVTKSPDKASYVYGDVVTLTASANTGYSFASWSGDASGTTNPYALTINGNKSVTANFTQNQYTLSVGVSPTGSGSVTKSPDKASYVYGDVVTLTASANTGYSFASWSGDASGTTNPYALTINGNKSVTANFTQNQYTLSVGVSPTGSGSVTKSPDKASYVYGDVVTLTASANTGYSFASWSGDAAGTNQSCFVDDQRQQDGDSQLHAEPVYIGGGCKSNRIGVGDQESGQGELRLRGCGNADGVGKYGV